MANNSNNFMFVWDFFDWKTNLAIDFRIKIYEFNLTTLNVRLCLRKKPEASVKY